MTALAVEQLTLDAAIRQLVNLGEKDPLVISRKIEQRYDEDWLREELYALREDIITELARARVNGARRSAMRALRRSEPLTKKELMLRGEWVPNYGWKALGEWTAEDLMARANYYTKISGTALKLANWCHECAELIRKEKVSRLKQVKADLPELPYNGKEILENGGSVEDVG